MSNENSTTNLPRQSRVIGVILYSDNDLHLSELDILLNDKRCVGIYHDKDLNDDGELKKPHWHFLVKFDYAATIGSIKKLLPNHEDNLFYYVKSFKGQARYLLHLDNPEKTQYDSDYLIGNVSLIKKFLLSDEKFASDVLKISNFIESYDGIISFPALFSFIYDIDAFGSYRSFQNSFLSQLKLHNERYK